MVNKINKEYKYLLKNEDSNIISKPFYMIEDNKKIKMGQMLSSLHCNMEISIHKDVSLSILKYDVNNNLLKSYNLILPCNKLKSAYNELKKKKNSELFVTSICQFYEVWELNHSIYIDFQVYPLDEKCDYILLSLPTFKIQYFE